jgi:hypothetical protein
MGIHSTVKIEKPVFDFGIVASGSTVEHEFKVQNTGKGDLVVNKVIPSCGCTAGKMEPDVIEPGDSGVIKVAFNTTGFSGRKVKTIRLYTNDPESDSVLLTLKGEIEPDTKIEPKQVFLTDVIKDGKEILNGKGTFTVSTRSSAGVIIGKVKTYSPHLRIRQLDTSKTNRSIEVEVLASAPKGELRDKIIVSLKGGKRASVNVPVYAVISGPVKASQSVVSFGVVKGETPIRKSIKIDNRGSRAVAVKEVKSTHKAITASIIEAKPGHNFVLHLDLNPQLLTSDLKGTVSVVTDSKETGTIPVSVVGILPVKSKS